MLCRWVVFIVKYWNIQITENCISWALWRKFCCCFVRCIDFIASIIDQCYRILLLVKFCWNVNIDSRTCKAVKCYWQFVKRNLQFLHQLATILGPELAVMASAWARAYNGGLGACPQRGPGAEPLVGGSGAKPPEAERKWRIHRQFLA